jgi:uncharacterized membrane protein
MRVAILRGLGVILPPLVTIVIIIWIYQLVSYYIFEPVRSGIREVFVWAISDIRQEEDFWPERKLPENPKERDNPSRDGVLYQRLQEGDYVPKPIYDRVINAKIPRKDLVEGRDVYRRYVDLVYLQPWKTAIAFICLFILVLYFLGKFVAAEIGRFVWGQFEALLVRLPLVRTIYSAAKQVSDFLLSRPRVTASRVVAVEWPRKGSWALGFVTSEGMRDIHDTLGEPVLTVLIATSPMPATGFTVQVRKSDTIDLGISLEDALQFIFSCGVVVPPSQLVSKPSSTAVEVPAGSAALDK